VSTLPTHHGEKTVIRILKHDMGLLDLANIGIPTRNTPSSPNLSKAAGDGFRNRPNRVGKVSTLFACLNRIRGKAINITTIENPIEYKINGVNQVQINEKAGVTFAATLRSILRQDPDVILIGEIRDGETAEIAVQAAQTGHLVLSTLHTNDSLAAITRLRDLGIPGFSHFVVAAGILAQRLVRVLCPTASSAPNSGRNRRAVEVMLPGIPLPPHYAPVGCDVCHAVGYKGRTGIFELASVNETVRNMISENASDAALRSFFRAAGMKSMIQNGLEKIEQASPLPTSSRV